MAATVQPSYAANPPQTAEELFKCILQECPELSSLPQTLAQIIALSADDNASINDLAHVIERDPGLATRTLRAANSPYFGHVGEISSIRQAAQTVGFRNALSFALASSVYSLSGNLEGEINRTRFWRHSLEAAVAARLIADAVKDVQSDEAFVSGLLHDIGMLIYDHAFTARYAEIMHEVEAGAELGALEVGEWGASHAATGAFLLRQWNIPEPIASAVADHHLDPSNLDDTEYSKLTLVVALANTKAHHRMFDRSGDDIRRLDRRAAIIQKLGLDSRTMERIDERLSEDLIREAAYLQIDVGDRTSMLQEANRTLYAQYLVVERLLNENRQLQESLIKERTKTEIMNKLQAISGTYHHYINNALATIQGNLQMLGIRVEAGKVQDSVDHIITRTTGTARGAAEIISAALEGIDELTELEMIRYHDDLEIINLDKKVADRRKAIESLSRKLATESPS